MQVRANGLSIEVDIQGPADGAPLVLLMGLGMQLTGWPEPFVEMLTQRGHKVIRLDNRDAGLSQGFDHLGTPNVAWAALRYAVRLPVRSTYTIADMAADTIGVLDALNIDRAHIVGASMGGMIAQHIAAKHPQRVSALTLMMTTSGARSLPKPSAKARAAMLDRRGLNPKNIEAVVDRLERVFTIIGSPAYRPADEQAREAFRARLRASVQRAYRPAGVARQLIAVAADGDRSTLLARVAAPTHIIHGTTCATRSAARRSTSSKAWVTICPPRCGLGWRRWSHADFQLTRGASCHARMPLHCALS
jgi:pimeloyl-ACP methyl ester carboxylesterase